MTNPRGTPGSNRLRNVLFTSLLATLYGCSDVNTDSNFKTIDTTAPVDDWQLVWSDEFDGPRIDTKKWNFDVDCQGGGNNEKQCYTDSSENAYVADGMLHIVAKKSEAGSEKPYTSARLNSKNKGDWKYGRIEIRAKFPVGQGTWSALWMLPTDEVYGGWPKSGEIDIAEALNLKEKDANGNEESRIYGTLHYGKEWPDNASSGKAYTPPDGIKTADDFHDYAIEWQENEIRWYMDGYLYATQRASEVSYNANGEPFALKHKGWFAEYYDIVTGELTTQWNSAPFDQKFHLIMNLAVGGDWPENINSLGIDDQAFENGQSLIVDYVRVYECGSDPDTGKGCETIRAGYDQLEDANHPEYALVEGKAPVPTPPSSNVAQDLNIFSDGSNTDWAIWDCCGGSTPQVVMDDEQHQEVAEFVIGGAPTVMGFITRSANGGGDIPYDASSVMATGKIQFEMKVVSAPNNPAAPWLFKIESNNAASAVELPLNQSAEGLDPVVGEWQTYTFTLQQLADAGLDLSAIDVLMIFPTWGQGEGAQYYIDNVNILTGASGSYPELALFESGENPDWPMWDCCGGSTPVEATDDKQHGTVAEFAIGANPTVMGFITRPASGGGDKPFDASALLEGGLVQFDMKVVSSSTTPDAPWLFKIESDNAATAVELPLTASQEGQAPQVGEWQTYTFTVQQLADAGLDISTIDVLMVFPAWGQGEGAVYRLDNVKIFHPENSAQNGFTFFADEVASQWSIWDCCGGSTPTVEEDDTSHGNTAQYTIGASPTVMGFFADDGVYQDASTMLSDGVVRFEMKVISAPNDPEAVWKFKIEAADATSAVELDLTDSLEGKAPEVGQWQTYTFSLMDLFDKGLDVSAIDVVMVFPAWGSGDGAVYRLDNAAITTP